jgi:hypothetical protein
MGAEETSMPCTNPNPSKLFVPAPVPAGSVYTLTVTGLVGEFSAFADYDDPAPGPFVHWSASDIVNKVKPQALAAPGDHVVQISIGTLKPGATVEVKTEIRLPDGTTLTNCHPVNTHVSAELNFHLVAVV